MNAKICLANESTFEDFSDLGILCGRWIFPPPAPKTQTIDILTADGNVDATEVLTGGVPMNNVQSTIHCLVIDKTVFDWDAFVNKYNGQRVKVSNDAKFPKYRVGRCVIENDNRSTKMRTFDITIDADPYWYSTELQTATISAPNASAYLTGFLLNSSQNLAASVAGHGFSVTGFAVSSAYNGYVNFRATCTMGETYAIGFRYNYPLSNSLKYKPFGLIMVNDATIGNNENESKIVKSGFGEVKMNTNAFTFLWEQNQAYPMPPYPIEVSDFVMIPSGNVSTFKKVITYDGNKVVIPTVTASANACIIIDREIINIDAGIPQKLWQLPLHHGENEIIIYSTTADNSVTFTYDGGWLE